MRVWRPSKMQRHLDGGVLGNDASAAAGGIKEGTVHRALSQHLWQGAAVVVADDRVRHAQALHVAGDGSQTQWVDLIGKDGSCVPHQGCYVGRLATCTQALHLPQPLNPPSHDCR